MFANLTVTFLLFLILVLNLLLPLELFVYLRLIIFNSLPLYIRSSDSLATFISRLKSHLFSFFFFSFRLLRLVTHTPAPHVDLRLLALYK